MAVTGDVSLDFSGLPDTNPYTPPSSVVVFGSGLRIYNGKLRIWSAGGIYPSAPVGSGPVLASMQVGGNAGDYFGPAMIDPATLNGFCLVNRYWYLYLYPISGGTVQTASSILAYSAAAINPGDTVSLRYTPSSNTYEALLNGSVVSSVVDTTYSSSTLTPAYAYHAVDYADTGASSWAASGLAPASSGTTVTVSSQSVTASQYRALVTYLASITESLQVKSIETPVALASASFDGTLRAFDGESHGNSTSVTFLDNAVALSKYLANASALVNLLNSNQAKESSSSKALAKADTNNVLVASDSKTSVASVATGILESIVASDGSTDTSKAVSSLTEHTTTSSLQKAVVDALTAFSASAASGDQFVQDLIVQAFLNEGASATDKLSAVSAIVDKTFTSESLNTSSAFLVSIKTLTDLLENVNTSEVITAIALLVTSVSELSSASDSFNASGQYKALFTGNVSAKDSWDQFVSIIAVQISEVVNANDFYQAYALVSESIFENANLLDSYSNIHQHAAGYLVANAITLAAALSKSDINLETILNGIISILPKK